jgi:hypothetical protein
LELIVFFLQLIVEYCNLPVITTVDEPVTLRQPTDRQTDMQAGREEEARVMITVCRPSLNTI